jgi:Transcriptional regulator containing an amidase domain and an AraC-type DNA-binding HTH domain
MIEPDGVAVRQSTDFLAVSDRLIRQALAYMEQHYRRSIGAGEIASELGVSRRTLELRFRKALSTSPKDRLIEIRLNKAKNLLEQGREPIESIAALTGFCHAPHFSKSFKRAYGLSPSKYRALRN